MTKPIRVQPNVSQQCDAVRWVYTNEAKTTTNYVDVLRFMCCATGDDEPGCLIDSEGEEFGVGDWVVRVNTHSFVSMSEHRFQEEWRVV